MATEIAVRTRERLSTGHEIELPLRLRFATGGVVVPARRRALERALPSPLSPVPIAPGFGCVSLVGIQYHRVGRAADRRLGPTDGGPTDRGPTTLEPYDEFAVIVPAVRVGRGPDPLRRWLDGAVGGYVHWLPVTTDASVALGREIWGYPKERTPITVTDGPDGVRAIVEGNGGETVCRLSIPKESLLRRRRPREWSLRSFTTKDGELMRSRADVRGRVAAGPATGAAVEFGDLEADHPLARLEIRKRPLLAFVGSRVRAQLSAPERDEVGSEPSERTHGP